MTEQVNTSNPIKPTNPLWLLLSFVLLSGMVLLLTLLGAYRYFPRKPPTLAEALSASHPETTKKPGFWERLFSSGRPARDYYRGSKSSTDPLLKSWGNITNSRHHDLTQGYYSFFNEEHLLMREYALSQLLLYDRFRISMDELINKLEELPFQGPYRRYEIDRLRSEILWMRYSDNRADKKPLKQLATTATQLSNEPTAFFEDFYNAGIAGLLNGNVESAYQNLEKAYADWPARGRAYGNLYLALLVCHGIREDGQKVLGMLSEFRDHYPDWFYGETFLPDFADLLTVYPDSALLRVIRGRLFHFMGDYASAYDEYQNALQSYQMNLVTKVKVRDWVAEIEEVKKP